MLLTGVCPHALTTDWPPTPLRTRHFAVNFVYAVMFNLLNMPAGVLPVTSVSQEDLDAAQKLDGSRAGVADIKVVRSSCLSFV